MMFANDQADSFARQAADLAQSLNIVADAYTYNVELVITIPEKISCHTD